MKTLYEILEVSENASKEVIEKAYKVLAKKYHPDVQQDENKIKAEQKMKEINEAYAILSDDTKRNSYNEELARKRTEEAAKQINNYQTQQNTTYYQNNQYQKNMEAEYRRKEKQMRQNMQAEYQEMYKETYEDYLRNLGYKVKHKWTWKNFRDFLITISIMVAMGALLWFIPPTRKMLINLYQSNQIIQIIVNIIGSIFSGIWNFICSIFTK